MEQVRPRAALEEELNHRIAILALLVTGLALPAPSAFAHGNQFICARVTIGDDGLIALELTADHGDNPNIADAAQARQVLRDVLRIQVGATVLPLEQLAPLAFSEHERYRADTPLPSAADQGVHRLVTATWQARLPAERVVFVAQERTPFDVVMWPAGQPASTDGPRWALLIAGDRSPEFQLRAASVTTPTWLAVAITALVVAVLALRLVHLWREVVGRRTANQTEPSC